MRISFLLMGCLQNTILIPRSPECSVVSLKEEKLRKSILVTSASRFKMILAKWPKELMTDFFSVSTHTLPPPLQSHCSMSGLRRRISEKKLELQNRPPHPPAPKSGLHASPLTDMGYFVNSKLLDQCISQTLTRLTRHDYYCVNFFQGL